MPAITAIYSHYVAHSTATFDLEAEGVPDLLDTLPGKDLSGLCKRIDPELVGAALFDSATLAEDTATVVESKMFHIKQ